MVPYKDPGRGKKGQWRHLLAKDPSANQKATAANRTHINDLEACGKKNCYFLFHSEAKFLTCFDVFLYLVILPYCNAISLVFCSVMFNLHLCCVISMFVSKRMLYERFKCFKNLTKFLSNYVGEGRGEGVH